MGFSIADEHQQYLEVAQGIVYGPHTISWEQERGMRNSLYPGFLASILFSLEHIGIHDPVAQAAIIRAIVGIALLAAMAALARGLIADGHVTCGMTVMIFSCLNPDFLFMSVRTLSETAMLVPFVFGYALLGSRPAAAGFLFGMAFGVRFQSAFFIAPICAISLFDDFRARHPGSPHFPSARRLLIGLGIGLLATGFIDLMTWGSWFHSPIEYFRANILENKAATFGTEPWHFYFTRPFGKSPSALPLIATLFLLLIGSIQDLRIAIVLAVFFLGHSAVGHKEFRFLWPIVPLLFLLLGEAYESIDRRLASRWRVALATLLFATFVLVGVYRVRKIDWNAEPSRSCSLALVEVGKRPDLRGVAIFGIPPYLCGNYFYLRRDVPILIAFKAELEQFLDDPLWDTKQINYLITYKKYRYLFVEMNLEEVGSSGELTTYRITNPHIRSRPPTGAGLAWSSGAGRHAEMAYPALNDRQSRVTELRKMTRGLFSTDSPGREGTRLLWNASELLTNPGILGA